jgi:hypothetical protein
MPTIGDRGDATSYPNPDHGATHGGDMSLGTAAGNYNAANFPEDPPVLNASPATRKSYSWNRGDTGNAT